MLTLPRDDTSGIELQPLQDSSEKQCSERVLPTFNISQNSSRPTSTGSSVSDVTRRTPPTAKPSVRCGLTRDAGETRPVSTGDFMDVSRGTTAGSLQQAVDGLVLHGWVHG